jgi:hypothetical protein
LWRRAAVLPGRLLAVEGKRLTQEDDVRTTTAFKRLLRLPGHRSSTSASPSRG